MVVPRKGDVDRNSWGTAACDKGLFVVPRKGDVDRNMAFLVIERCEVTSSPARGTWIEITFCTNTQTCRLWSSPARGTWIEIRIAALASSVRVVVPRKGDVDRNMAFLLIERCEVTSSPARGTWIEIGMLAYRDVEMIRRPPQGGRG